MLEVPEDYGISEEEQRVVESFFTTYLPDTGIQVQILEALCRDLFTQPSLASDLPQTMFAQAISDVTGASAFSTPEYSLKRVVDGAASLEFIIRYARKVDPRVLPAEVIPSEETVNAALAAFHAGYALS